MREAKSIGPRGKFTGRWNYFLRWKGRDGVGILRQRNAMHKIPKFPHVVSHGEAREDALHSRSRATCYVAPSPALRKRKYRFFRRSFLPAADRQKARLPLFRSRVTDSRHSSRNKHLHAIANCLDEFVCASRSRNFQ